MSKKTSKRAIVVALVSGLLAAAVSLGYINEATAAIVAGMVTAWVVGDTVRPSGTAGAMGQAGPISGK